MKWQVSRRTRQTVLIVAVLDDLNIPLTVETTQLKRNIVLDLRQLFFIVMVVTKILQVVAKIEVSQILSEDNKAEHGKIDCQDQENDPSRRIVRFFVSHNKAENSPKFCAEKEWFSPTVQQRARTLNMLLLWWITTQSWKSLRVLKHTRGCLTGVTV
jgi:hypothetical protein